MILTCKRTPKAPSPHRISLLPLMLLHCSAGLRSSLLLSALLCAPLPCFPGSRSAMAR